MPELRALGNLAIVPILIAYKLCKENIGKNARPGVPTDKISPTDSEREMENHCLCEQRSFLMQVFMRVFFIESNMGKKRRDHAFCIKFF